MQETSSVPYFDEIDLKPYLQALIQTWYLWIGIPIVIGALTLMAVIFLFSPSYRAVALVSVTDPQFEIAFDDRFTTTQNQIQGNRSFPELALSDDVLSSLYAVVEADLPDGIQSQFDLASNLTAERGDDLSIVRLITQFNDPVLAAKVANEWAVIFINSTNTILGSENVASAEFLTTQLEEANLDLVQAEEALIEFEANNRLVFIRTELAQKTTLLETYQASQRLILIAYEDINTLRSQVGLINDASSDINVISLLILQLNALGLNTNNLTIGVDNLGDLSQAEQLTLLNSLETSLQAQEERINSLVKALEPEIFALQSEETSLTLQAKRLNDDIVISRETYTTLNRKVEESQISSGIEGAMRLASRASVPADSESNLTLVIVMGFFSFFVTIIVILGRVWIKEFSK